MENEDTEVTDSQGDKGASDDVSEEALFQPLAEDDPSRLRAEKSASKMSWENFLLRRYIEQSFDVRKDLRVTMRSLSSMTGEFIFRHLTTKYGKDFRIVFDEAQRRYYIAATLQKINDTSIGGDLDEAVFKGDVEATKVFEDRLKFVQAYPSQLIDLLYRHYLLFAKRVEDFIRGSEEEVKNS